MIEIYYLHLIFVSKKKHFMHYKLFVSALHAVHKNTCIDLFHVAGAFCAAGGAVEGETG